MPSPQLRTITSKSRDLPCPCGGTFGLASVADGADGGGIFHSVPYCAEFELREPQDYVHWVVETTARAGLLRGPSAAS